MKPHTILKTVRPPVTVAMILARANPRHPAMPQRATAAALPTHSAPQAVSDDTVQWRGEILQRYETPIPRPWRHGGLND
jgi:hypothetical protein